MTGTLDAMWAIALPSPTYKDITLLTVIPSSGSLCTLCNIINNNVERQIAQGRQSEYSCDHRHPVESGSTQRPSHAREAPSRTVGIELPVERVVAVM
jgi:hypothetical protein